MKKMEKMICDKRYFSSLESRIKKNRLLLFYIFFNLEISHTKNKFLQAYRYS